MKLSLTPTDVPFPSTTPMKDFGCPEDSPFSFSGTDHHPVLHHQTIEIFRSVVAATGTSMT